MAVERELVEIEKQLWKNDAGLYYEKLTDEALLVFPETGVIGRDTAVEAILAENAGGKRWAEVRFDAVRTVELTGDVALLTYRAVARWAHESSPYTALASSVYVRRGGTWKLALHQQSPLPQENGATASPTSA
jgi:ketosteroid isomerase-like protein